MSKAIGDATPTTNRKSGGVKQPTTIKKERQPCQSSSDNQRADRPRWLSVNRTFWLTLSRTVSRARNTAGSSGRSSLTRYLSKKALSAESRVLTPKVSPLSHSTASRRQAANWGYSRSTQLSAGSLFRLHPLTLLAGTDRPEAFPLDAFATSFSHRMNSKPPGVGGCPGDALPCSRCAAAISAANASLVVACV